MLIAIGVRINTAHEILHILLKVSSLGVYLQVIRYLYIEVIYTLFTDKANYVIGVVRTSAVRTYAGRQFSEQVVFSVAPTCQSWRRAKFFFDFPM